MTDRPEKLAYTRYYEHDGLRSWGTEVVSKLFAMRRGEVYTL